MAFALGVRHGTDPDHLTAIDGLSRMRPRASNGLLFAMGHGSVVTLLAAGVGHVLAGRVAFLGPWMLILIGVVNLWKVCRPTPSSIVVRRPIVGQPILLGLLECVRSGRGSITLPSRLRLNPEFAEIRFMMWCRPSGLRGGVGVLVHHVRVRHVDGGCPC